jgi:hypothetical protein
MRVILQSRQSSEITNDNVPEELPVHNRSEGYLMLKEEVRSAHFCERFPLSEDGQYCTQSISSA